MIDFIFYCASVYGVEKTGVLSHSFQQEAEMHLADQKKLVKLWQHAFGAGADVVVMRHAPKSGADDSDLSEEGGRLAAEYGKLLNENFGFRGSMQPFFVCTSRKRTEITLQLLFPFSDPSTYRQLPDLDASKITPDFQSHVNLLHKEIGRWRGYAVNHTHYFLEKLSGRFDEENHPAAVAERMARGIRCLWHTPSLITIYCGHSPNIEIGLKKLLGVSLSELGGFLNPLDSVHLKVKNGIKFVARINPIVGYVDMEGETHFS